MGGEQGKQAVLMVRCPLSARLRQVPPGISAVMPSNISTCAQFSVRGHAVKAARNKACIAHRRWVPAIQNPPLVCTSQPAREGERRRRVQT